MWFDSVSMLRVGLAADHMVAAQGRRSGPSDGAAGRVHPWRAAQGAASWQDAIRALSGELANKPRSVRRVEVVLSNRLVRWQLLSVPMQLTSAAERQVFAQSHFESVYGKRSEHWLCHPSSFSPGAAAPVCAVDSALVYSLQAACTEHGVHLASVAPYWSQGFDYWHRTIREKAYWLAQIEPDVLTLGLIREDKWLGLRSVRTSADLLGCLTSLQAQMLLALQTPTDIQPSTTPVFAIGNHSALGSYQSDWCRVLQPTNTVFKSAPQWRLAWGI